MVYLSNSIKISATFIGIFLSLSATAKEITFGTREARPYVIKNGADVSGLDHEIIAAALAHKGHSLNLKFFSFARLAATFNDNKELDGAAPVLPTFKLDGKFTEPFTVYENIGLSLKKSNLTLKTLADLSTLKVIAFQNARVALGPDFAAAIDSNPNYREETNQNLQLRALFNGNLDVVIGERRILNYLVKDPTANVDASSETMEHRLFKPLNYSAVFRDPALAEDFNAGLAAIKASGLYDTILQKY